MYLFMRASTAQRAAGSQCRVIFGSSFTCRSSLFRVPTATPTLVKLEGDLVYTVASATRHRQNLLLGSSGLQAVLFPDQHSPLRN